MPSTLPRRSAASPPLPLLGHRDPRATLAWRHGQAIPAARFLADVARIADAMPEARAVLNTCADRYRFAAVVCAAALRGQLTLLPPATTPHMIGALRDFASDAYWVGDDAEAAIDLPRFTPPPEAAEAAAFDVPAIDADRAVACVFTSGSTGAPRPHFKRWGSLVRNIAGESARLGVGPGHAIIGTVPSQHMYGFESTIWLPLLSGAAMTAARPYYPADIDAAIAALPAPRVLFTTPFHLRAWLADGGTARVETIVSATAPLSVGLAREAEARTGAALLEIYGCTESGQVATRRPSRAPEWDPLEGIRIWNEGAQAMVDGAHVDEPTPLMDVIEPLADGRFILHGRSADMVNIAGKRNSLGYLNHQLTAIAGVEDGAFFLPDETPDGVTRLMAFVVAPGLAPARILEALRERIDPAFLPRPLVRVECLPRQLTGKLPREALQALAREHAAPSR
jgi:acyl-coenzyme A synthetase/AMP-(fatty) acid ligase